MISTELKQWTEVARQAMVDSEQHAAPGPHALE
jgi:hypothetical protein